MAGISGWDQWLGMAGSTGGIVGCRYPMKPQSKRYPPALAAPTSRRTLEEPTATCLSGGFPFPDGHPPPKARICRCGLGQEAGTVKTANERREGVVMGTAPAATGDVPKEAAEDWEWERVGMLQHQSICWQRHSGWYKLGERLWMRYRKGHVDDGTAGSSLEQQGSRTLETLLFAKGAKQTFPA